MTIASVARLVEVLRDSHLLDPSQSKTLDGTSLAQFKEPRQLGADLVARGWLTSYQLDQALTGHARELTLGEFVILEPIGEGGMGTVFKARQRGDGKLVALKVIHKERRTDARVLSRFRREVQAITRLEHPNIITAIGADEAANAHYFAMEYVEGTNLDKVIARVGPMPIAPACDYIRQAAQGLQHAHERGLIHRDIKPGNLLIIPPRSDNPLAKEAGLSADARARFGHWGIVKILDLGLVLLQRQHRTDADPMAAGITKKGFSLGTVDYVAPEQVMNPHEVDIRADLYSLGCTFYEMLTGQTPFPEGSPVRKLYYHQTREPKRVEELRPDVPSYVVEVVRKLMAKEPMQRYQTPAACAAVLGKVLCRMDRAAVPWDWKPPGPTARPASATGDRLLVPEEKSSWLMRFIIVGMLILVISLLLLAWSLFGGIFPSRAASDVPPDSHAPAVSTG